MGKESEIVEEKVEETVEAYHGTHSLIYSFIGFLGYTIFVLLFCGSGILALLGKVEGSHSRLIGLIFFGAGLFILYKDIMFVKDIIKNLSHLKKSKRKIITLHDIGYFVISLVFVVVVLVLGLGAINPNSALVHFLAKNLFIIVVILGLSGTALIYADYAISFFRDEEEVVVADIKKKEKEK